ncbi:MAG: arsenate reductase ArsC [Candidatus Zixiibacteriota bacterium]
MGRTADMKNILFVCSYNACRSQMAEGLARALADGEFEIRSAGINAGGVNSDAIASMRESGIDISRHTSDRLTPAHYDWADYVVTVCDAAKESCPVVPNGKRTLHWSIPDPYGAYTSTEEKNNSFSRVREMLREKVAGLLESIRRGEA